MELSSEALVWIDLEMTGLDPKKDKVLEIAVLITDKNLNILGQGIERVIHQSDDCLKNMSDWVRQTHEASGLISRVKSSSWTESQVEAEVLEFLKTQIPAKTAPLCGNSIWQDRRFICEYFPQLDQFLHYRCIDVSTIKELAKRWQPGLVESFQKKSAHTALSDIEESIGELRFYREKGFVG